MATYGTQVYRPIVTHWNQRKFFILHLSQIINNTVIVCKDERKNHNSLKENEFQALLFNINFIIRNQEYRVQKFNFQNRFISPLKWHTMYM